MSDSGVELTGTISVVTPKQPDPSPQKPHENMEVKSAQKARQWYDDNFINHKKRKQWDVESADTWLKEDIEDSMQRARDYVEYSRKFRNIPHDANRIYAQIYTDAREWLGLDNLDIGAYEFYVWAKADVKQVIQDNTEGNYYHFCSDAVQIATVGIDPAVNRIRKRAFLQQSGMTGDPLSSTEINTVLREVDKQYKVHVRVGAAARLRVLKAIMEATPDADTLARWKMRQPMGLIGLRESESLADFVFYVNTDDVSSSDSSPSRLKRLIGVLNQALQVADEQNEVPTLSVPRHSVRLNDVDGTSVHPAISIVQGDGQFKDYLTDMHQGVYRDHYVPEVNGAMTQRGLRLLESQNIRVMK